MKTKHHVTLAAACVLLTGLPLAAQEYHSNDLTPAGWGSGKLTGVSSGKQVGGSQASGSYNSHAVLLSGNALTAVDLNPTGAYYSMATCMDDTQQGGWAYLTTGLHAVVWSGSSSSCSDLHPSGYNFSYCLGVHNGEQVGYAQQQSYFISASHAYCWHGSAASGVDLHSGTLPFSRAWACHDGEQVGYTSSIAYPEGESTAYRTGSRASCWHGTAASMVDLHPLGYDSSEATCTSGTQEGGWGYIAGGTSHVHALLWTGTADSVVDLHPASYTESRVNAMNATRQVGDAWVGQPGFTGSVRHAVAWSGTADSVIDLNQYLPAGYTHGVATGIDANGNIVGYAYNGYLNGVNIQQTAIAVVFAPGAQPPGQLSGITLASANVVPGASIAGTVTLSSAAPAGGVTVSFLSLNAAIASTPASVAVAEGESSAAFTLPVTGGALTVPTLGKVYATDGATSRSASFTVTPVVNLAAVTGNTIEGGFSTTGSVSLSIPAQAGGATISLTSSNPSLVTVPASVTVPQGYGAMSFSIGTAVVTAATTVPITASFNGQTATANVSLSPQPVVALAAISIPSVIGGQSTTGTVSLTNFSRNAAGTTVTLQSGDTGTLQVPASVTIPYGYAAAYFSVTTNVVTGSKGVSVKATMPNSNLTTTVTVNPIPPITFLSADWDPDTLLFKVSASVNDMTGVYTFGTDPALGAIGTMQFELGIWKGSILMNTAPSIATIWSSFGATASMPVTIKGVSSGGTKSGGGGGGGGGGGSTSTSYKISVSTAGKGAVTMTPSAASYAPGTVVTLTATPAAGSPWVGWTGAVVSKSQTISVTVNSNLSLTANFK
ncbi:MAG: hypothetical protein K1X78_24065 [Verrucomicrobiaceae bacterium]|nr:hypothetical protein [Verrucomicrobiaceae bacterium]